jgi:response regulator RpfG family c-di-GMP phosphodiesterase
MSTKILLVDDEEMVLSGFKRTLRGQFEIETALGPEEGLAKIKQAGPFAAVVSDLKMPGMDGIQFLTTVREASPNTVRIMLTGYADLEVSMAAVNSGQVFRFLTKPCPPETLALALSAALEQYRLVMAEKTLLEKTLRGCIEVLSETIALVNPEAFGRASRVKRYVREIAKQFDPKGVWRFELAAMLGQLGCLTLPEEALRKLGEGKELSPEEKQLYEMYPLIGQNLLSKIPRMGEVAQMIAYQEKHFDGTGVPRDTLKGEQIPLGARILKVALDFDLEISRHKEKGKAFLALEEKSERYDPEALYYLECLLGVEARFVPKSLPLKDLREGMILNEDVFTSTGLMLARKSLEVNPSMLIHLAGFAKTFGVKEPISVLDPVG